MNGEYDRPRRNANRLALDDFSGQCREHNEPGFLAITPYSDDRGWSLLGLMQGVLEGGQVNFSTQYAGVVKAWHRHALQTDYWCVVTGTMNIGIMDDTGKRRWLCVTGEKNPGIVIIPPSLWHGEVALGSENAGLLYYVTNEYNPSEPDEQRQPFDWQWNPWPPRDR